MCVAGGCDVLGLTSAVGLRYAEHRETVSVTMIILLTVLYGWCVSARIEVSRRGHLERVQRVRGRACLQ
jgi:hypothetical protein